MKRGLIILLFLGLSWGSVFAGQELFNGNICEQFLYRGEEIIKSICYSNEDEKSKQELDWKFNNFLTDKNYYYLSQEGDILVMGGLEALEELEKYKDTYDNYNYYLGQLSLFISEGYRNGGYMLLEGDDYITYKEPNLKESEKYFKIYEENKEYKLKRVPYNFLMTYLNTSQEDMIEKKVDEVYEIFKNNISSLSTNLQNGKKTELIAKINSVYNEEDSDFVKYTLLYLKYIIQEEIYRYLVDLYKSGEYEKVIENYKNYVKSFDFNYNENYTIKYKDLYHKITEIFLQAYLRLFETNSSKDFYIQAEKDFASIKSAREYFYYSGVFSCHILGKYIYMYPWQDYIDEATTCTDLREATYGGFLLGR